MATTTFLAPDIVCGGCANAIRKALGAIPGVSAVAVNVDSKQVTVTHDSASAAPDALTAMLDRAGFPTTVESSGPQAGSEKVAAETSGCSCCKS